MPRKPAFIRHSPEREAQIQSRLLDVLEARFKRRIASVIAEESRAYVDAYERLGYVPAPSDDSVQAFRDLYQDMGLQTVRTFGARVVSQGKALGYDLEAKQEGGFAALFRSLANLWINQEAIRRRITRVTETTRARIVSEVARGQQDGLGVAEIAKNINRKVPSISRTRGALIGRTETHGAANFAMHETAKSTGLELEKEWVATEDARTRRFGDDAEYDHVSMHGQTRPMDEPFDMPWMFGPDLPIMYPGEAGKPGSATINCRCASIHRVVGLDDEPATSVAAQAAAQGAPMTMEQAIAAKPIIAQNHGGSLNAAPPIVARVISKAPDLNGMITGKKGAYAMPSREISMGQHSLGSKAYARVFRHEFGHTVDYELAEGTGKRFKSVEAVGALAKETTQLDKARTGLFMGDKGGTLAQKKRLAKNRTEFLDAKRALIDEGLAKGYAKDAASVIETLTPLKYDDVLKLYDVKAIEPDRAFSFATAWHKRDVHELLFGIPAQLYSPATHQSALAGMQDTFEAGTAGKVRIQFGHGEKYYRDRVKYYGVAHKEGGRTFGAGSTAEAFANWFEAFGSPNKGDYALFKHLWPETSQAFENMLEEYVNA